MNGKVVLITGGNSGVGRETAVALARAGAHVLFTSRDAPRGAAALDDIRARSGSKSVEVVRLDLASLDSVRACAADVLDRTGRLDVLICNAGLVLGDRRSTSEGFEMTFGVNHLGHFLLTSLLTDLLVASAPSRVVVVSSEGHRFARRGLPEDVADPRRYHGFFAYACSKLANILFTRELARRLDTAGVTANALHPGFVASRFARDGDTGFIGPVACVVTRPFQISPERGARTSVYLTSSREVEGNTGGYYQRCRPREPSCAAGDDDAAALLWASSEELTAPRG